MAPFGTRVDTTMAPRAGLKIMQRLLAWIINGMTSSLTHSNSIFTLWKFAALRERGHVLTFDYVARPCPPSRSLLLLFEKNERRGP